MNLHQAASFYIPAGIYRGKCLACVALDDPDYLGRLARDGAAECPKGSQFHTAVTIVHDRIEANRLADILREKTIDPHELASMVADLTALNAQILARDARRGRDRRTGGASASRPSASGASASGSGSGSQSGEGARPSGTLFA